MGKKRKSCGMRKTQKGEDKKKGQKIGVLKEESNKDRVVLYKTIKYSVKD